MQILILLQSLQIGGTGYIGMNSVSHLRLPEPHITPKTVFLIKLHKSTLLLVRVFICTCMGFGYNPAHPLEIREFG